MRKFLAFIAAFSLSSNSWAAFSFYKQLTLSAAQSGSVDSASWPLTVGLDGNVQALDTDLKDTSNGGVIRPDGFDIYFYSDSALTTRIPAERVVYDGSTGKLEAHVLISNLSHTSDTIIYMAYGDASISSDPNSDGTYGKTSVWNSHYKGVWHLPNGSTLTANDSTSAGNNGTITGATAVTGQIDGAGYASAGNQIIDMGSGVADLTSDFTISGWFNRDAAVAADRVGLYSRWTDLSTNRQIFIYFNGTSNNKINVDIPFIEGELITTSTFAPGTGWNNYVVTKNGTTWAIYINGNTTPEATSTQVLSQETGGNVTLGNWIFNYTGAQLTIKGYLDETRISDTTRSTSWITADYNSQKISSTFVTWGSKVAILKGCAPPFCGIIGY